MGVKDPVSPLRGRRVLVTGASSGIGAATATALSRYGCELTLVGRDEARLAEVAEDVGASRHLQADLTREADLARVAEAGAGAEVLINNAGVGWAGDLAEMSERSVRELVEINVTAPVELSRRLLPSMRDLGHGHIILVSSIAAVGVGGEAVYAATKAALRAFGESLRYEAVDDGIAVTTVLPGAVRTPYFARRGRGYERSFPRPVSAERVAHRIVGALDSERHEIFVPDWLTVPARMQAVMPRTYFRLARWFGQTG